MDYAQGPVATLHDLQGGGPDAPLGGSGPDAPVGRASVVVPMTDREYAGLAAERVLRVLESLDPGRVVVPLRCPPAKVGRFADWLDGFDVDLSVLWCNAPALDALLDDHGVDGEAGKGRDVWLALGVAGDDDFVVLHDADTKSYTPAYVRRLLFPVADGFAFSKGYYARVENRRLYGRLCRLLYAPLVAALADRHDDPVLDYLGAFRYALAGECAMTGDLARSIRVQRRWGLEVGTLGEAYEHAGPEGVAQVDLGRYEHDHRAVSGPTGLSEMSHGVTSALLRVVEEQGVEVEYETLPGQYRETARRYVRQYAADAGFNGLEYDSEAEREQVAVYSEAVREPEGDTRLPAWEDTDLEPRAVAAASREALDKVRNR